jgi:multicomponent Na+:H+ antiporter subunit C
MTLLLALVISVTVAAGVLLLLSRDVFRTIIGLAVLGGAVNLAVFFSARPGSLLPPVIERGAQALPADAANPLPQALVLTAIVIGFALLCYALVLGAWLARRAASDDPDALRHAEPVDPDPVKPTVLEP